MYAQKKELNKSKLSRKCTQRLPKRMWSRSITIICCLRYKTMLNVSTFHEITFPFLYCSCKMEWNPPSSLANFPTESTSKTIRCGIGGNGYWQEYDGTSGVWPTCSKFSPRELRSKSVKLLFSPSYCKLFIK